MVSRIFLDANVILDKLLHRDESEAMADLFDLIAEDKVRAFTSPSVLHMVIYFLEKYKTENIRRILLILLNDIELVEANQQVAVTALTSRMGDIEDALQYFTAVHNEMDVFLSHDKKLQQEALPILPVQSVKQFIRNR
jgi:predicted nucleic acid-binding protein